MRRGYFPDLMENHNQILGIQFRKSGFTIICDILHKSMIVKLKSLEIFSREGCHFCSLVALDSPVTPIGFLFYFHEDVTGQLSRDACLYGN